jgi:hypothetical protein
MGYVPLVEDLMTKRALSLRELLPKSEPRFLALYSCLMRFNIVQTGDAQS